MAARSSARRGAAAAPPAREPPSAGPPPGGAGEGGGVLWGARRILLLKVLMVDEVEPHRLGFEHFHGGAVLVAADGDDVVAGAEATERVPLTRRIGVGGRPAAAHGDDRRAGVAA